MLSLLRALISPELIRALFKGLALLFAYRKGKEAVKNDELKHEVEVARDAQRINEDVRNSSDADLIASVYNDERK